VEKKKPVKFQIDTDIVENSKKKKNLKIEVLYDPEKLF
jgi:hypothetical protein